MPEKSSRHGADLDLGITGPLATPGAPGKSTLSSKLFRRPSINISRSAARDDNGVAAGSEEHVERAASSSGSSLPSDLRERFESALGADLSGVRIHTGGESETAASAVGARAYTVGNDIHFGAGQYAPTSSEGQLLIAHEVAHTVQQAGSTPTRQNKLEVSTIGDSAEVEADRAAAAMVGGGTYAIAGATPAMVHRKVGDTEIEVAGGDNEYSTKFRDGKLAEAGYARKLFDKPLGTTQICVEPPLYLTASASGKVAGAAADAPDKSEIKGTATAEITGSIVMGAVSAASKIGIEGSLKGSASAECAIELRDTPGFLPDASVSPFTAELVVDAYLGLVAEAGEGPSKIGGSIKRHLSSLKLGTLTWDGSEVSVAWTADSAALKQAAKDLVVESAKLAGEVLVPGYGAYRQHEEDRRQEEIFHANTARMEAESGPMEVESPEQRAERDRALLERSRPARTAEQDTGQNTSAEEQKKLIDERHPRVKAKVDAARAKANAAKGKCNGLKGEGVKPAAQKLYSEGFQLFSTAEADWATVEAAAAAGDNEKHFNYSIAAEREFEQSAEKFAAGDAAQG